jgi:hypothetical protein
MTARPVPPTPDDLAGHIAWREISVRNWLWLALASGSMTICYGGLAETIARNRPPLLVLWAYAIVCGIASATMGVIAVFSIIQWSELRATIRLLKIILVARHDATAEAPTHSTHTH